MADFKFLAGNAAFQFLRGPMWSNLVKSGAIKRGKYHLSQFTEEQLRERLFFGRGIPSVRAVNEHTKTDCEITSGGVSPPLLRGLVTLRSAWAADLSKQVGVEMPSLPREEFAALLDARPRHALVTVRQGC